MLECSVRADFRGYTSAEENRVVVHRVRLGCGIFSITMICRNCTRTDANYGTQVVPYEAEVTW